MKKTSVGRKSFLIFNYLFLAAVCLTCVLPFVNLLAVSFSGNTAVAAGKVTFGRWILPLFPMNMRCGEGNSCGRF